MTNVRAYTQKDLPKIAAIERACFTDAWSMEMIKTEANRAEFRCLLVEEGEEPVGFLMGSILFEDGEIYKVAILPEHRKKGLGERAVVTFAAQAKEEGARQIFLEVRVSNQPALALYTKHGFEKTRIRKRYYADGEDCIEMRKSLYPDEE